MRGFFCLTFVFALLLLTGEPRPMTLVASVLSILPSQGMLSRFTDTPVKEPSAADFPQNEVTRFEIYSIPHALSARASINKPCRPWSNGTTYSPFWPRACQPHRSSPSPLNDDPEARADYVGEASLSIYLPLALRGFASVPPTPTPLPTTTYSLHFYGTGSNDIDRVKIPMGNSSGISLPVNVGAADFTLEFWLRFAPGENGSGLCTEGQDTWINGNIIFDRDIFGVPDYGDFGISLYGGRIAFGVHNGNYGYTICGNTVLTANQWHHVAVTRDTDGWMRIFVNGALDREYNGPAGNISYHVGRSAQWPSEPYLVIGAEKHDYDPSIYPSFSGWIDEVRISNVVRYMGNFTPPNAPFTPDAYTVGLYHMDEGSGTIVLDSSNALGGPSHGERRVGGPNNGPAYDSSIKRF